MSETAGNVTIPVSRGVSADRASNATGRSEKRLRAVPCVPPALPKPPGVHRGGDGDRRRGRGIKPDGTLMSVGEAEREREGDRRFLARRFMSRKLDSPSSSHPSLSRGRCGLKYLVGGTAHNSCVRKSELLEQAVVC